MITKESSTTITTTTSAFSSMVSWLAITASPESVLSKLMFLVTVKLRTLGKVVVVVARAPVFCLLNQLSYLSLPAFFYLSSFMGVQIPEYMALIGQPIETLDKWSQSVIIGGGGVKPHPEPMFNRTANQKLWPCITRLKRGGGRKVPPSLSLIGEPPDNILIFMSGV